MAAVRWLLRCLLLAAVVAPLPAFAQTAYESFPTVPQVDWYYASTFGTGRYKAGARTVSALQIPIAWNLGQWRDSEVRVRLLAPITLGAVDFQLDDVLDDPIDSVGMVTITPGIELELPAGEAWVVRPFANFGGGFETKADDRAWIWSAGVGAQRALPCARVRCALGLAATWAGYSSNIFGKDDMSSLSAGLDFIFPASASLFDRSLHPGLFLIYRNYLSDAGFIFDPLGIEPLSQEWELGFSFNADRPFSVFGLRFDRLGIAYRRGGELQGIHFTGKFPF